MLRENEIPLLETGETRFLKLGSTKKEEIVKGVVEAKDGSLDEWLSVQGVEPMITVECFLAAPQQPPLAKRIATYSRVLEEVFKLKGWL